MNKIKPKFGLVVDVCVFNKNGGILLIKRKNEPFKDFWALPGGFIEKTELVDMTALRELKEETGITKIKLYRIGVFDDPKRDPRGRIISLAYWGRITGRMGKAGSDAKKFKWFSLKKLPKLGFDHKKIIATAIKMKYEVRSRK